MDYDIDLRAAMNAISDVIQNRPRPIRVFDQIFMKAGDMVLQSEFVAAWSTGKTLAFIGDGDSISVSVAYLQQREILRYGPESITVFDFDERMVSAINRFADAEGLETLSAQLYNCIDPFEFDQVFDCFYTNPPWGASNAGSSVNAFALRGIEAVGYQGEGTIVIADHEEDLSWPAEVLANAQAFALEHGFYISRMMPRLHSYHLDDNPELRSCNLMLRSRFDTSAPGPSSTLPDEMLKNFYGQGLRPEIHYVREQKRVDYGRAHDDEYTLERFEDS